MVLRAAQPIQRAPSDRTGTDQAQAGHRHKLRRSAGRVPRQTGPGKGWRGGAPSGLAGYAEDLRYPGRPGQTGWSGYLLGAGRTSHRRGGGDRSIAVGDEREHDEQVSPCTPPSVCPRCRSALHHAAGLRSPVSADAPPYGTDGPARTRVLADGRSVPWRTVVLKGLGKGPWTGPGDQGPGESRRAWTTK